MPRLGERVLGKVREAGVGAAMLRAAEILLPAAVLNAWFRLTSGGHFVLNGCRYPYFRHTYNRAFDNERTVEVALVRAVLAAFAGGRVLEVGNVLKHYTPTLRHDVVDKYEQSPGVINEDIASFEPAGRYDLVVSISTLEHVGWDEDPKDPAKVERVVHRIREQMLAPGGAFVVTMPLGYNPHLDRSWERGSLGFDRYYHLMKISAANRWREATREEVRGATYGPYQRANAIVVGVIGQDVFA